MDSDQWKQVDSLLQSALHLLPGDRNAFVTAACAGDEDLEREVRSLLACEQQARTFLEKPAFELAAEATALEPGKDAPCLVGKTISHYEIVGKLGAGGMGVVWKARDTRLHRFVALKFLPAITISDPERKRRFVQEARTASALNHPNIVTIYDVGQTGPEGRTVDFIAMEFVRGKPLDCVIPPKGLPLQDVLKYSAQVAGALVAAHAAGIVHRDLKPGNIMVGEDGRVKLLDFGSAKLTERNGSELARNGIPRAPETDEGMILGTVAYMSPEQAEGRKLDARTDVFSFGSVLYEMITGRRAFAGDSIASILAAVLRQEPEPASEIVRGLPRELDRIVTRCLRKDPARRFQTMADLEASLADLKHDFESGTLAPAPLSRRRRIPALEWPVFAALLAAGLLAGWLVFSPAAVSPGTLIAVPLTAYPGSERNPTFSPDGAQLAFSWDSDKRDNFDIYVKLIGAGPPLRLTTDPADDFSPAWSPDGHSIAFMRRLPGGRAAVMLISPLGGPERLIAETGDVTPAMWETSNTLSWSPDSKYLAAMDKSSPGEAVGLFLLSVETGEKRRLTQPPPTMSGDSGPAFSPDGRMLAFTRATGTGCYDLYVVRLSSTLSADGEPQRLTFDNRRTFNPAWMPDGREIVFCSNRSGLFNLWRIPVRGGKPPQRVESVGEDGRNPAVSRTGHRLAYTWFWSNCNIWRIDLSGLRLRPAAAELNATPVIVSTRLERSARSSPDGKRVALSSDRSGYPEIWLTGSDGSNPAQLTNMAAYSGSPAWSPDGRSIAFDCNAVGHFEVYVVGANGGRPKRLTTGTSESATPAWSRDGKWIYFRSVRSGESQVWKIPSAGGAPVQVTRNGGGFASAESTDGAFLYYTKADPVGGLWKVPVAGGEETRVLEAVVNRAFAVVADGIYFFAPGPSQKTLLQFYDFAATRTTTLGTIENQVVLYLDVSSDGRWLLYSQRDHRVEDLMLVENFH